MKLLVGDFYCRKPLNKFEKKMYECRYLVHIPYFLSPDMESVNANIDVETDIKNLIDEYVEFCNHDRIKRLIAKGHDKEYAKQACSSDFTSRLKPHVIQWLDDNIEDRKDDTYPKGYCVGNDDYNKNQEDFVIFFHRRNDAIKFIKEFSVHKKYTVYSDSFKNVRKILGPNGKYVEIK